jgi:hypothetical protein
MDKVLKQDLSKCITSSSEPFRIDQIETYHTVSVLDLPWLSPANTASRKASIRTVVFICNGNISWWEIVQFHWTMRMGAVGGLQTEMQGCLVAGRFGAVVVSLLATGPNGRRFKPGRGHRFIRAIKIRSTHSFAWEVKPEIPCRKILRQVNDFADVSKIMNTQNSHSTGLHSHSPGGWTIGQ